MFRNVTVVATLVLVFTYGASVARPRASVPAISNDGTCHVAHLAQMHSFPGWELSPGQIEMITRTQDRIARYILERSSSIKVVDETLGFDMTPEYYRSESQKPGSELNQVRSVFSDGYPSRPEELTAEQKTVVYSVGGARTLFYLGRIPTLYGSAIGADSEEIAAKGESIQREYGDDLGCATLLDPDVKAFVNDRREEIAARRVREICESDGSRPPRVALIFGAFHDFSKYFQVAGGFAFERMTLVPELSPENVNKSVEIQKQTTCKDFSVHPSQADDEEAAYRRLREAPFDYTHFQKRVHRQ
ncbi:MAG: hypothetical protein V1495_09420 [Pseudomonadota bacterium]